MINIVGYMGCNGCDSEHGNARCDMATGSADGLERPGPAPAPDRV